MTALVMKSPFSCFRNENPGFKRIVEKLERSPVCQRLPFRSFLVLPFQRITRIKLLVQVRALVCVYVRAFVFFLFNTLKFSSFFFSVFLQNIVKRTTPGTPEATHAIKSLKLVEKVQDAPRAHLFLFKTQTVETAIEKSMRFGA